MTLLDLLRDDAGEDRPAVIPWEKDEYGHYHRLLPLHPDQEDLDGEGGVYVLWHWGSKPEWIHVGATDDLGRALEFARDSEAVLTYEPQGGIFVTWAYFKPEYRAGVSRYLNDTLEPKLPDTLPFDLPEEDVEPVAVLAPH